MTEDEIERRVEALFDMLDWRLMSGELTQAEYDRQAAEIAAWADEQYKPGFARWLCRFLVPEADLYTISMTY